MKYWRFSHDDYQPYGGINDLQGEFDSLYDAQQFKTEHAFKVDYIVMVMDDKFTGLVWHKENGGRWIESRNTS